MSCASRRDAVHIRVRLELFKHGYGPLSIAFMSDAEVLRAYLRIFDDQAHRLGQCITEFGLRAKIVAGSFDRLREVR